MSREADDNPAYITVIRLNGAYHINKMEWDDRAGDYQVTSEYKGQADTKLEADEWARKWAEEEGVEVR